jgi:hypothetical protein
MSITFIHAFPFHNLIRSPFSSSASLHLATYHLHLMFSYHGATLSDHKSCCPSYREYLFRGTHGWNDVYRGQGHCHSRCEGPQYSFGKSPSCVWMCIISSNQLTSSFLTNPWNYHPSHCWLCGSFVPIVNLFSNLTGHVRSKWPFQGKHFPKQNSKQILA